MAVREPRMAAFHQAIHVDDASIPSPRRRGKTARKVASTIGMGFERSFETKMSMTPPARLPGSIDSTETPFGHSASAIEFPHTELSKRYQTNQALPRSKAFGPFSPLNGSNLSNARSTYNEFVDNDVLVRKRIEKAAPSTSSVPVNKGSLRRTVALQGHLYTAPYENEDENVSNQFHDGIPESMQEDHEIGFTSLRDDLIMSQHTRSRTSDGSSFDTSFQPRRRRIATTPNKHFNSTVMRKGLDHRHSMQMQDPSSSSPTSPTPATDWSMTANKGDLSYLQDDSDAEFDEDVNTLRPGASFSCRRMSGIRSISTSHSRRQSHPMGLFGDVTGADNMARSMTTSSIPESGSSHSISTSVATSASLKFDASANRNSGNVSPYKTPSKRRARVQGSSSSSLRGRNFSTASPVAAPPGSEEGTLFGSTSSSSIVRGEDAFYDEIGKMNKDAKRRSIGSLSPWREAMTAANAVLGNKQGLNVDNISAGPIHGRRTSLTGLTRLSSDSDNGTESPNRFTFDDSGVAIQSPASVLGSEKRLAAKHFALTNSHLREENGVLSTPSHQTASARRNVGDISLSNDVGNQSIGNSRIRSSLANEAHFSDAASSNESTPEITRTFRTAASVPEGLISPVRSNRISHKRSSLSSSSLAVDGITAPYLTPQNYKNVIPLQAAFMSTGLASKRTRPTMGNLDPLTGETLPPLPAKLNYNIGSGLTTAYQSSGTMAASLGLRDVVAAANAHKAATSVSTTHSTMPDTPMKRPLASFGLGIGQQSSVTGHKAPQSRSRLGMTLSPTSNDGNDSSSGGSAYGCDSPILKQDFDSPTLGLNSVSNAHFQSPKSTLEAIIAAEPTNDRSTSNEGTPSTLSPSKDLDVRKILMRQSLPNQSRASEESLRAQVMTRPLSLSRPPLGLQRKSSFGPNSDQSNSLSVQSPLYDITPATPTRNSATIKWYEAAQLVSTPSPSHRRRANEARRESWQKSGSVPPKMIQKGIPVRRLNSSIAMRNRNSYFSSRFVVQSTLGQGEFSQVDKVEDKQDGVLYAVKRAKKPFLGPRDRLRKLEEVDILRYLGKDGGHLNIVAFFDAWEEAGHLFIQTELCPCVDFSSFLQHFSNMGGSLDEARLWKVMRELSEGLGFIHDMQVLHLDLKPANIFITEIATLKIGDFGLATRWPRVDAKTILRGANMGDEESNLDVSDLLGSNLTMQKSKSLEREGDREYIAPEIILCGEYSKAADVFSLGLVMLEAAGNVILPDNGEPWHKLRNNDLSDVDLGQFSLSLVNLIRECLRSQPDQRPTLYELRNHPVLQAVGERCSLGVEMSELDQLPVFDLPSGESSQSLSGGNKVHFTGKLAAQADSLQDEDVQTDMHMTLDEEFIEPSTPKPFSSFNNIGNTSAHSITSTTAAQMERTSSGRSALGLEGIDDDDKVLNIRGALIYEDLDFLLTILEAEPDPQARLTSNSLPFKDSIEEKHNLSSMIVPTINVDLDDTFSDEQPNRLIHAPVRASPLRQASHDFDDMDMDEGQ